MAKRFIDTGLFDDPWFMDLSIEAKILWIYMITRCNHAGIIELNPKMVRLQTDINSLPTVIEQLGNRLVTLSEQLYFIPKFITFQYPGFPDSKAKAQESAMKILQKYSSNSAVKRTLSQQLPNCYGYSNGNDNDKKGGPGENIKPPWAKNFHHWSPEIQYPFESEKFGRIWDQWLDYKKQRNLDDYTSISESEAINNLVDLSQGDLKKAEIMVKHSIARNWKSINPPDKKKEPFPEESPIKLNADEITKKNNSRPY